MYEDDTGLIYMRARYYSPVLRRFVNADKVHGDISNSLSLNRYAFVNGNPASNVDPLGLSAERGGSYGWNVNRTYHNYGNLYPTLMLEAPNKPLALNRYAYFNGNPASFAGSLELDFVDSKSSIKKPLDWSRATPEEMNRDIWEYIKEESKVGDGEYALIDNYRNQIDGIFHEQWFIVNVDENKSSVSLDQEISFIHEFKSISFELTKGEWNFDKASIGVLNLASISASVDLENGLPEIGASVSIWNPEFSIKTKYGTIHAEINVGCFEIGTVSYMLSKIFDGDLKSPGINLNIDVE